jgi:SAM-dependent methyltransferase
MGAVARARLASFANVAIERCTFEAWPLEPEAFDLVISAQAFHWVAPEVRFTKTANALRPGGALAVFGNTVLAEQSALHDALDDCYRRHAPALLGMADSRWYEQHDAFARQVAESGRFEPVAHRVHPWAHTYSADAYIELMRTHSNHRLLPDAQREALHAALADAIERHGGEMPVRYEAHLYVATRV